MLIKGWVNPRFLDCKWYTNFTVSLEKKSNVDVPVVISCHDKSFEGAQLGNDVPSYGDLEQTVIRLRAKIDELEKV